MSYYEIADHKVFVTPRRRQALDETVLGQKGADFRISSTIAGRPAAREADTLRFRYLVNLHRENPRTFYDEWVRFDLRDDEVEECIWDLLYDYFAIHRTGKLIDIRSTQEWLRDELDCNSYTYPMGKVFAIQIPGPKSFLSLLGLRAQVFHTVQIGASQFVFAYGTLDRFRLVSDQCVLECGKELSIVIGPTSTLLENCLGTWITSGHEAQP